MLDTLKGKLFNDDVQVKTLIVSKHVERRIPENFIFVGIKITTTDQDTGMIQANKAEAIALYKQSKPTEA